MRRQRATLLRHRTHRLHVRVVVQGLAVLAVLATEPKIGDPAERRGTGRVAARRAVGLVVPGNRIVPGRVEVCRIAAGLVVLGRITADRWVMLPTAVAAITMRAIEADPTTARTAAGRTTTPAIGAERMAGTTAEGLPTRAIEERGVRRITISPPEARRCR